MSKESKTTKKLRNNIWFTSTLFLSLVIVILLMGQFVRINEKNKEMDGMSIDIDKSMCSSIEVTPAWTHNNKIIGYGYTNFKNNSLIVIDEVLIPNNISFYYSSQCGYCHKQIEEFGEEQWNRYVQSGLTVDCFEVLG